MGQNPRESDLDKSPIDSNDSAGPGFGADGGIGRTRMCALVQTIPGGQAETKNCLVESTVQWTDTGPDVPGRAMFVRVYDQMQAVQRFETGLFACKRGVVWILLTRINGRKSRCGARRLCDHAYCNRTREICVWASFPIAYILTTQSGSVASGTYVERMARSMMILFIS